MTWNSSGITTTASYALPDDVLYTQLAAGNGFSFGLKENGAIDGVGADLYNQVSNRPSSGTWIAVAAGYDHGLALKNDGTLAAWGDNTYGQGEVPIDEYAQASENALTYTAIAAGEYFNLALRSDGTIFAWGHNQYGKLDVPNNTVGEYVEIAAGGHHAAARKGTGTMKAWGGSGYSANNCSGSYSEYTHPGSVPSSLSSTTFIAIGAGHTFTFGIRADRTVVVWGCGCGVQGTASSTNGYYVVGATNANKVTGLYAGGLSLSLDAYITQWGDISGSGCSTVLNNPPNTLPSSITSDKFESVGKGNSNFHGVAILKP
ncbi:MAG: RCC1 domain-containing protein [Phycisphaerales bacterium]